MTGLLLHILLATALRTESALEHHTADAAAKPYRMIEAAQPFKHEAVR